MSALVWMCVACGLWNPNPAGGVELIDRFERVVEFRETAQASSASGKGALLDAEIRFALPAEGVGQRFIGDLEEIEGCAPFATDRHGNRIRCVKAARIEADGSLTARWRARVVLCDRVHHVRREALLPLTCVPPSIAGAYLGGGGKHALGDASLAAVAKTARAAAVDSFDLAFRLNEAVRERLTYDRDGRWDDAATTWKSGQGSCSEYHFVFATLARLAGLPCRFVGATAWRAGEDDESADDLVFHRWSEVWLPGYGWFPVDVSRNDEEDGGPINAAFGETSRALLILCYGDGDAEDPLGTGYVSEFAARREGDAAASRRRVISWSK
jgi:hypothetical protein